MDATYINKTTLDAASCKEFMSITWAKNLGWMRYLLWSAGAVGLVYGAALLWQNGVTSLGYAIFLFVLAAAAIYLAKWGWQLRLKRYTRQQIDAWKGETLTKEVRFGKEGITQESPLGTLQFPYEKLTFLTLGNRMLVLWMGNQVLMLERAGFTKGTEADFIQYITRILKQNKKRNNS